MNSNNMKQLKEEGETLKLTHQYSLSSLPHSPRECYEKLLQVQLGILREGNLYPQRRMKVIHVHIERGQRHIPLDAKPILCL